MEGEEMSKVFGKILTLLFDILNAQVKLVPAVVR